ncbi:MAG: hypothetical protein WAM60_07150, partial [Candidatus Promineifilaceae bacterium]
VTSGFHLLFAYILSGIYSAVHPDANGFVVSGVLVGMVFALLTIAILLYWGLKRRNLLFLMFLALVITSQNFVYNTVSITEWAVGIFVSASYCVWFFTRIKKDILGTADFIILFILGLLGSVARSDSGILPFSLFSAVLLFFLLRQMSRRQLLFALTGLVGTVGGLVVLFVHNYLFAGELLQSSARMKAYWGEFVPPGYYAAPVLIGNLIGVLGLLLLAVLIGAVVWPRFFRKDGQETQEAQKALSPENKRQLSIMLLSSGICLVGYTLFYSRGGGVQPWYSGNLIVPLLIFIYGLSTYLALSLSERAIAVFGLLFAGAVTVNIISLYPANSENSVWSYHTYLYEAGTYLSENPQDSAVGAWNAGIIGYYEGGHVINLDGLVNKDIYPYAINNDLSSYLARQNIHYVLDFERMITDKSYRLRGGYEDPDFITSFVSEKMFDNGDYGLILYRVGGR